MPPTTCEQSNPEVPPFPLPSCYFFSSLQFWLDRYTRFVRSFFPITPITLLTSTLPTLFPLYLFLLHSSCVLISLFATLSSAILYPSQFPPSFFTSSFLFTPSSISMAFWSAISCPYHHASIATIAPFPTLKRWKYPFSFFPPRIPFGPFLLIQYSDQSHTFIFLWTDRSWRNDRSWS